MAGSSCTSTSLIAIVSRKIGPKPSPAPLQRLSLDDSLLEIERQVVVVLASHYEVLDRKLHEHVSSKDRIRNDVRRVHVVLGEHVIDELVPHGLVRLQPA